MHDLVTGMMIVRHPTYKQIYVTLIDCIRWSALTLIDDNFQMLIGCTQIKLFQTTYLDVLGHANLTIVTVSPCFALYFNCRINQIAWQHNWALNQLGLELNPSSECKGGRYDEVHTELLNIIYTKYQNCTSYITLSPKHTKQSCDHVMHNTAGLFET